MSPEQTKTRLWWMSFCDPQKPKGKQFLGAAIVPGDDEFDMMTNSHRIGCNPGGEVKFVEIRHDLHIKQEDIGRLMNREQVESWVP